MTADTILLVLAGACAGGFVSGVSGFAFGLVALAFWIWRLEPQLLAPMVVFGSCITQLSALGSIRRALDWPRLLPFLAGGLAGVPVGMLLLGSVDVTLFKFSVGLLLVAYSSWMLLASPCLGIRFGGRWADGTAGFMGGVMGGLAGLNGPAPVIWCTVRGWDKDVQRGVTQAFILAVQIVTFAGYAAAGQLTRPVWDMFGLMLPAVLASAWIGARVCSRISDRQFRRVVLVLLLLSGLMLMAAVLRTSLEGERSPPAAAAADHGHHVIHPEYGYMLT